MSTMASEPRALTLLTKWQAASQAGDVERARRYLIELRALAQRPIERGHLTEAERLKNVASTGKVRPTKNETVS